MRFFISIILLLFLVSTLGAQVHILNGKRLYAGACAPCHGIEGYGDGPDAKGLNPSPKDLTTGWYKFRSSPHGQMPTDEDIVKTIAEGVHGTTMPAFEGIFDEDEMYDLVDYIKTFTDRFERWGAGEPIDIPSEIPVTEKTVAEGRMVYRAIKCWECHGHDGRGKGPQTAKLKDEKGNPTRAMDFKYGTFKAGDSDRTIYNTFNTGLSSTQMGTFASHFYYTKDDFKRSTYEEYLSDRQMDELFEYVSTLPSKSNFEALSEKEREAVADERRWALVHYVKSLSGRDGWFYKLFIKDIEVTE